MHRLLCVTFNNFCSNLFQRCYYLFQFYLLSVASYESINMFYSQSMMIFPQNEQVQNRLFKSHKVWEKLAELEQAFGTYAVSSTDALH